MNHKVSLILGLVVAAAVLVGGAFFVLPHWTNSFGFLSGINATSTATTTSAASSTPPAPQIRHVATPKPTRALYMTQCYASMPALRARLIKLADETEINAIVLDLKDYSGTVSFPSAVALPGGKGCVIADFKNFIEEMHDHNIYVIGRLTVFQDPLYTKAHPSEAVQSASTGSPWRDRKGLSFVDVSSKPFHDYIIALAREAHNLGVDEMNFDYIRYPSDGNMKDTRYIVTGKSHAENLEDFFKYLSLELRAKEPGLIISADLFGMTATNFDDLNIGQVLERTLPYFDYIDPMIYPSHYPPGFNGWKNPNEHPYDIVRFSMLKAGERALATTTKISVIGYERMGTSTPAIYQKPGYDKAKIRPWLQDFNYPVTYTAEMVRAQIKATYDAGLDSWLMWDPANKYTSSVYGVATSTQPSN